MSRTILVTGATGRQGGAVARSMLEANWSVVALVRDPSSTAAVQLALEGAQLVQGDLDDPDSLQAAAVEAQAVFSIETADYTDFMGDAEVRRTRNLVTAARASGVETIVHTSVSGAGIDAPAALDETLWGAFPVHYWRSKRQAEQIVRTAGFSAWTILRPATFMENLRPPSIWFAGLTSNRLAVVGDLDAPRAWVAVKDIGSAARVALENPERFHTLELELAGDYLSLRHASQILNVSRSTPIELPSSPEQAIAWGVSPELASSQLRVDAYPAPARPEMAHELGIETTTFSQWIHRRGASDERH